MRVLITHNRYASTQPSGENRVVEEDVRRLREAGVNVSVYLRDSDEIDAMPLLEKATLPLRPTYSLRETRRFRAALDEHRPEIVHLHNVYPLISPQVIRVAKQRGARVVQTVHNYRHTCASGIRFRAESACDDCVGRRVPWPAIQHGCYRGSRAASAAIALSLSVHRSTWQLVDLFLAVGPDVMNNVAELGIPDSRILLRPNALPPDRPLSPLGEDVVYVGRLAREKGVSQLLDAWASVNTRIGRELHIAGDGPLSAEVEARCLRDHTVTFHGLLTPAEVDRLIDGAALLVLPSLWPEPDPLAAISALAAGRPILATNIGALSHYLDSDSGWLVEPTPAGLADGLLMACANQSELSRRGSNARELVVRDRRHSSTNLLEVYEELLTKATHP